MFLEVLLHCILTLFLLLLPPFHQMYTLPSLIIIIILWPWYVTPNNSANSFNFILTVLNVAHIICLCLSTISTSAFLSLLALLFCFYVVSMAPFFVSALPSKRICLHLFVHLVLLHYHFFLAISNSKCDLSISVSISIEQTFAALTQSNDYAFHCFFPLSSGRFISFFYEPSI